MRPPPRGVATVACVVILVAAAVEVRLPAFVERPLEPLELSDIVDIDGRDARRLDGTYAASVVARRRATSLSALGALAHPHRRLRWPGEVVPPDVDDAAYRHAQRRVFAHSVDEAAAAALSSLGRSVPRRTGGVVVVEVVDGSPADGRLTVDDVLLAIDGDPLTAPSHVRDAVEGVDDVVTVVVERDGAERPLRLRPARFDAGGQPMTGLGVVTAPAPARLALPVEVTVDAGATRGPSAGLMIAVALVDLLDDERNLAAGRRVTGTGRIDEHGDVTSVSAVPTKVRGAIAAGGDVFLVPESQRAQAETAAAGRIRVIGVATLDDAVDALAAAAPSDPSARDRAGPPAASIDLPLRSTSVGRR